MTAFCAIQQNVKWIVTSSPNCYDLQIYCSTNGVHHPYGDEREDNRKLFSSIKTKIAIMKRYITICVEGNIGSGKTTMLEHFGKNVSDVEVCEEPVRLWQNVGGSNLLDIMYRDPKRWSYTFQTYTLLTMMKIHNQEQVKEHRLMERSAYSAVYCFVENLYLSGNLSKLEYKIHHEWFDWLKKVQMPKIDLFVYIRTPPEACQERLRVRGRKEEEGLPLVLLQQIHDRYEDWLVMRTKFDLPAPVLVIDGDKSVEEMVQYYYENVRCMLDSNNQITA